jgi:hypothetical protein
MLKQLVVLPLLALILGSSDFANSASLAGPSTTPASPALVQVVEFYHAGLDHYFITADAAEITLLDTGVTTGWARTGNQFAAYASTPMGTGLSPVCRFYGRPEAGLDSHFYSGSPDECAAVMIRFATSWQLESSNVFQVPMPNLLTGACPALTIPVFRLFNNRTDANHRYTTDIITKQAMISRGYVSEGYGPDGVAFCAVVSTSATPTASLSASIVVTQIASDTFDFSSSAIASTGAAIVSYAWNFGDGTTDTNAVTSHKFTLSGTYPVVLTVTDSSGATATATRNVTATVAAAHPRRRTSPTTNEPSADNGPHRRFRCPQVRTRRRWSISMSTIGVARPRGRMSASIRERTTQRSTTNKASGAGALRFDIPSQSDGNAAGAFFASFRDRHAIRREHQFFVQWRQRFNQAFVDTYFKATDGSGQGGIKLANITTGDQPGRLFCPAPHSKRCSDLLSEAPGVGLQLMHGQRLPWGVCGI